MLGDSPHLARLCVELAAATRSFFDASRLMLVEHAAWDSDARAAATQAERRITALGRLVDEALASADGDTTSARRAIDLVVADGALEYPRHPCANAAVQILENMAKVDVAEVQGVLDTLFRLPEPDVAGATERISRVMEGWWSERLEQRETALAGELTRSVISLRVVLNKQSARLDEADHTAAESLRGRGTFAELLAALESDEEALGEVPLLWQEDLEAVEERCVPLLQLDGAGLDSFWPGASGRWHLPARSATVVGAR